MKEVITGKELQEIIINATNLICETVGSTLGPKGNNVLINSDDASPFITNDGVTIAKSIASNDKKIDTILEIIKEAALKTNEQVGDGTTTTLILLHVIINEGIKAINNGKNPIILKKELEQDKGKIITLLEKEIIKPTKKDLLNIATTSANDEEIGKIISELYLKMLNKDAIRLDYSNNYKTYYEIKNGYNLELDDISNLYFNNTKEIELNNVHILLINSYLDSLEKISHIINESVERNKSIIIFADDYEDNILNEIISFQIQYNKKIFIFKTPDYASRKLAILNDISVLSSSNIKNSLYEIINWNDLGFFEKVIIRKNEIIFLNHNSKIKEYIKILKKELLNAKNDYDKDFFRLRIAKLEKGIATIFIGGITNTEIKEKFMRYEDAINALEIAKKGIVLGEGITFLKISDYLYDNIISENILKKALQNSFATICKNSAIDYNEIKKKIINSKYQLIYNFENNSFDNINNTKIYDPFLVELEALNNAISIATIILTTKYLVINDSFQKEKIEF